MRSFVFSIMLSLALVPAAIASPERPTTRPGPGFEPGPGFDCPQLKVQRSPIFAVSAKTDWSRSQLRLVSRFTGDAWAKQVINPRVRVIVRWKLRRGQKIVAYGRLSSNLSPTSRFKKSELWVDDFKRQRRGLRLEATVQYKVFYSLLPRLGTQGPKGTVRRVTALPPKKTMKLRPVRVYLAECASLAPAA